MPEKIKNQALINAIKSNSQGQDAESLRQQVANLYNELRQIKSHYNIGDDQSFNPSNLPDGSLWGVLSSSPSPLYCSTPNTPDVTINVQQLKLRNDDLEDELEKLNQSYSALMVKFNDACVEIEACQSKSLAHEQKLLEQEEEIRRIIDDPMADRNLLPSKVSNVRPRPISSNLFTTHRPISRRLKTSAHLLLRSPARNSSSSTLGDSRPSTHHERHRLHQPLR